MGDIVGAPPGGAYGAPQVTSEVRGVAVRPAATLMVVRDGDAPTAPLEVLMVRRSLRSDFVGGAHVFPGGAVDEADAAADAEELCGGLTDAEASAVLEVAAGGLAYWVAAIRECFEEAGVLFARRADGSVLSFLEPELETRFACCREDLNAGRTGFLDMVRAEHLTLAADTLHYFSHWITPEGANRRFDTRYFVAPAPPGQTPGHNAGETISDVWVRPADALAEHQEGTIDLVLPTIRSLQAIGRFPTAAALLEAAASHRSAVPTVLPKMMADGHGWRIVLPGDPGHEDGPQVAALEVDDDGRAAVPVAPGESGAGDPGVGSASPGR